MVGFAVHLTGPGSVERFWKVAIWSAVCLSVLLIHRYAWMFGATFLGSEFDFPVSNGRNQLGGYLAYLALYASALCYFQPGRWRSYPPVVVLAVAIIYTGSRGAQLAVLLGLVVILVTVLFRLNARRVLLTTAVTVSLTWLVLYGVESVVGPLDAWRRLWYLVDPASVPELRSYEVRVAYIAEALDCSRNARFVGMGLGEALACRRGVGVHNVFISLLVDFGILGLANFLLLLGVAAWRLFVRPPGVMKSYPWLLAGARGSFVAVCVFMNTLDGVHNSPLFWLTLGMAFLPDSAESVHK